MKSIEKVVYTAYIEGLEKDRAELKAINQLLSEAGMAIGNEYGRYSVRERVTQLITIKDYFVRQTDELRKQSVLFIQKEAEYPNGNDLPWPSTEQINGL